MASIIWRPARFFQVHDAGLLCTLCPHGCTLADGELGACQVRRRRGDRLETATQATSVRHWTTVERKPLYHYRPNRRVLTLAAPGCSFACLYCQNYRISQFGRSADAGWQAESVEPSELVAAAAEQQAALGLSYSEPSLAAEFTLELAAVGRARGVEVLWKTNGFLTPVALKHLAPCLAAVNVDLKAVDERKHQALTGAPVAPVLAAIAGLLEAGVWVEISTPLIPKFNTDVAEIEALAAAIARLSVDIPWHLLRFTPEYKLRRSQPTSPAKLDEAVQIARAAGLRYVYVERALADAGRTTHCPQCHHAVVERDIWATRAVNLIDGACPACGFRIAGRW